MKKIIFVMFALFTIIVINIKPSHAIIVSGGYLEPSQPIYLEPGSTSEYSIYRYHFYSTPSDEYFSNLGTIAAQLLGFDSNTRIYSFRSDVNNFIEFNYPSFQQVSLPHLSYLVIEDAYPTPMMTFYNKSGDIILQIDYYDATNNGLHPVYVGFEILSYDYVFYNQAYNHGYDIGKNDGYELGKQDYGYYDGSNYLTANDYGSYQYDYGYDTAKQEYGINYYGQWLTSGEYGYIEYQRGINESPNENMVVAIFSGLSAMLGTGLAFILQLGSIEIMGISFNMILGIGLFITALFAILGLIYGGK